MESVPSSRATFIILNTDETYSDCGCNSQFLVDEIRKKVPFHAIFLWDETLHYLYDTANPTCVTPKATHSLSKLKNFVRQSRLVTDKVALIAPQSISGNTEFETENFVTCISPNELDAYIESYPEIASNPDKSKIISLPSPSSNDNIYFQNDSFTKENCGSDIIGLVEQFKDVTYQSGKINLYSFYGSVDPVDDIRDFPVSGGDFNPDALVDKICNQIKDGMKAFVIFNDDDTMDQFNKRFLEKAKDDDNIMDLFLKSVTLMTCNRVASFYECYKLTFDVVYPEFNVQNINDTIKLQIVLMPSSQNDSVIIAPGSIAELSFTGAKVQTHLNGVVKLSNENMSKFRYKKLGDQEDAPQFRESEILIDATHHLILDFSMEPCRIAGLLSYPRHVHLTISKGDYICFNGSRSIISNYLCGSLFDRFPYTVMVWGAPGSGKTSLISTMGNAMSLPYSKSPIIFMTIGSSSKHITSKFTKTKISKISSNGKNGNQSITNKLNTFFIDVPGADPEMELDLYKKYCGAALDGKIPQDVNIIENGELKLDNLCNPDPLMIPQAVILVMKQGTDPRAQEAFIQLCQRRNIHPILVWTHSKPPYDHQEDQDLGIHKEYIFHIDSYKNTSKVRNPETDIIALDILEAVHSEASLHHFRITKETYANAKLMFQEETPKEYVKHCGFPENTMLKVFLLGNEEPLPLSAPPESRTEFPFVDLPFVYRPMTEGAYVGIDKFKKLIKDNGGFDLTDYNFIMQKSANA